MKIIFGLILIILLAACSTPHTASLQIITLAQDTPKYSLSDVLYIAQQSSPGVPPHGTFTPYTAKFTAQYKGLSVWEIIKEVGMQYSSFFKTIWTTYGYFNEKTGAINWFESPLSVP